MERYAPMFEAQRVDLDVIASLTDADLKESASRRWVIASGSCRDRAGPAERSRRSAPLPLDPASQPGSTSLPATARAAERRQLTVMFCDLVGSTELAGLLDPEDLRAVIGTYHAAVTTAVAAHNGYVAQLLGDGVLVYFGYPHAHEDDAASAIHAALDVIAAVGRLAAGWRADLARPHRHRDGLVVVGEIGSGTPAAELSASGETPNLAARLQSQAAPDGVVIADQTRRLIGDAFELESLGSMKLKGFDAPVHAWQVLRERRAASRFEASHTQQLSRLSDATASWRCCSSAGTPRARAKARSCCCRANRGSASRASRRPCANARPQAACETMVLQCSPSHRQQRPVSAGAAS